MSLPIISFRATQLNVLALLKNLRNHILISVPFRTRMLELFSELLLVFTWSKEPSSLQKSTASMVLPQQQYQPYVQNCRQIFFEQIADHPLDCHHEGVPFFKSICEIVVDIFSSGSEN